MSEKIRRHTIIVTKDSDGCITGLQLEKDWYNVQFAEAYDYKVIQDRKQGLFIFLGMGTPISQTQAKLFTDNIILGKLVVVRLADYSQQLAYIRGGK